MLLNYVASFQELSRSKMAAQGKKPYKPALLLAVLDEIGAGRIQHNQIIITPELIAAFMLHRQQLGATGAYDSRQFAYPFYHLKTEGFWRLREKPSLKLKLTANGSISGLKHLQDVLAYASFDASLWELLKTEKTRNILRQTLLA